MMIETNKKMIKEIIHIPLFHSPLLDLASNWVIEFNILNLLFKGRFQWSLMSFHILTLIFNIFNRSFL